MKWFKHFTDASDDDFLQTIEDIFGLEGYARWWKLLEVIAGVAFPKGLFRQIGTVRVYLRATG